MTPHLIPVTPTLSAEVRAFDALERIGRRLGMSIDQDDPEQAIIVAVERAVVRLIESTHSAPQR